VRGREIPREGEGGEEGEEGEGWRDGGMVGWMEIEGSSRFISIECGEPAGRAGAECRVNQ